MYAVIEVGAKQFNVKKDDVIEVEKLSAEEGKEIKLDRVLLLSKEKKIEVGRPYLTNATVRAQVLKQGKGVKAISFKYWRRKSKHWTKGHRQTFTRLKITDITTQ
ncbi:MAG: 50S ribosomal protein L21 [Candidatus Omnitrophota bacterium]